MKKLRQYLSGGAVALLVMLLAAGAFAAPGGKVKPPANTDDVVAAGQDTPQVESDESETDGAGMVNHGHCVSFWAHSSKSAGLMGSDRGTFTSSIAQDPNAVSAKVDEGGRPDATCDFQAQLDEATSSVTTNETETQSSTGHGHGKAKGEAGSGDGEEESGS